jgi:hypothetical protein
MKVLWLLLFVLVLGGNLFAQLPGECNYFCGCHETEKFAASNINLHLVFTSDTSYYLAGDSLALCFSAKNWGIFPIDLTFPVARKVTFSLWQDNQLIWNNIPINEPPDTHIVRLLTWGSQIRFDTTIYLVTNIPPGNYQLRAKLTALPDSLILPIQIDVPVPVELTSFFATSENFNVQLSWTTATETNNQGFFVDRQDFEWQQLGFVPAQNNGRYNFTDKVVRKGEYQYRLRQIDYDGVGKIYGPIQLEVFGPDNIVLYNNYPNPFNNETIISFYLPVQVQVELIVFNILGNVVARLVDQPLPDGRHEVIFLPDDLPSGTYIYRLMVNDKIVTKKLILLK